MHRKKFRSSACKDRFHAAAREYIDAMPDTFREWISMPPERRFKVGHSAISGVAVGRTAPAPERSRDRAKTAA